MTQYADLATSTQVPGNLKAQPCWPGKQKEDAGSCDGDMDAQSSSRASSEQLPESSRTQYVQVRFLNSM